MVRRHPFICSCGLGNGANGYDTQYHIEIRGCGLFASPNCDCESRPIKGSACFLLSHFLSTKGPPCIALIANVRNEEEGCYCIQIYSDHNLVITCGKNCVKLYDPVSLLMGGNYLYEFNEYSPEYQKIMTYL